MMFSVFENVNMCFIDKKHNIKEFQVWIFTIFNHALILNCLLASRYINLIHLLYIS